MRLLCHTCFSSPGSIPSDGIFFFSFLNKRLYKHCFISYAELCILYIKRRSSSLNTHLLFELKKDIDDKGKYFPTCKSNRPKIYSSVSTLCLRTSIINSVLLDRCHVKKIMTSKNCCVCLSRTSIGNGTIVEEVLQSWCSSFFAKNVCMVHFNPKRQEGGL